MVYFCYIDESGTPEVPVNSELTSLVQIADLCCFILRRYFENNETDLFNRIENRIDRKKGKIVGARHFTNEMCTCHFCS